ncbi:hypothetical protein RhiirC2_777599 [Rhizophagus irregularis]|uniref:Uncharacterized protein n=1 Tax=Rhizophagus irregularis TaxID=588596 RepID=A0A2N1NDV1_9GLOM|nr:hypothetical protein RhiirC2_777599 [Rhizophagus irregularis]
MGDDTESECPSTSSSNTKITSKPVLETPPILPDMKMTLVDQTGKNLSVPEVTQILTGYKEVDDEREQIGNIIVYDISYTWDVKKILEELTLWGYFENWEATLKALNTSQVFFTNGKGVTGQSKDSNKSKKKDIKSLTRVAKDDNQLKNSSRQRNSQRPLDLKGAYPS